MAIELHIFMVESRVPGRDYWQSVIEQLGFPVVIVTPIDLRTETGQIRATFHGKPTGFEVYLEPAANVLIGYPPQVAKKVGNRELCVTFRWGSDVAECAAALCASAALAKIGDGIYYYPDNGELADGLEAIGATRKVLSAIEE